LVLALLVGSAGSVLQPRTEPTVRYFGFGANVDQSVMERRIGSRPLAAEPAVAHGYRLAFTALGFGPEPAFASIEPAPARGECHGVLYTLDLPQMARLCASEGVPFAYLVSNVRCTTYDGARLGACALKANGPGRMVDSAFGRIRPSARYLNLIRAGAMNSGLSESWLEYLDALEPADSWLPLRLG
jgi:hypothetical protein